MHGYIKKLQTEALKFLLSEYFFFKYTFTRPISFLDQKSVRRSSNIFCIYSYVKFEPPSWPNPTPKIMKSYVSQILGLHVHVTGVLLSVNIPGLSQYLNS